MRASPASVKSGGARPHQKARLARTLGGAFVAHSLGGRGGVAFVHGRPRPRIGSHRRVSLGSLSPLGGKRPRESCRGQLVSRLQPENSFPPTIPFLSPTGVAVWKVLEFVYGRVTFFTFSEFMDFNRRGFTSALQEFVDTHLVLNSGRG